MELNGSGGSKGQSPGSRTKHAPSKGQYTTPPPPSISRISNNALRGAVKPESCSSYFRNRACIPNPNKAAEKCSPYGRNCNRKP
ncbi:hypothetical protein CCACVL1_23842 [Corchorus capsularis]|uniref:Uncharacterized protein n=1 Tax=Corchorus capsularis TaxID=210143 RepID=A0A1R3GS79_COCAP|nr:hypothetical protein CCACVL1_23842 [Corchorus capsularis]